MQNSQRTNTEPMKEISIMKREIKKLEQSNPEHERVSKTVRESAEYFKAITRSSFDIVIVVDKLGIISYASPSVEYFLGYEPGELTGTRVLDLIVLDEKQKAVKEFDRALLTKDRLIPSKFHVKHKNGTIRLLKGVGSNLLDDPDVTGFVMNAHDITKRQRVQDELRDSELRYRTLFEDAKDGMALADIETGTLADCNRSLCQMVERSKEDLIGKSQTILHPQDAIAGNFSRTFNKHRFRDSGTILEEKLLSKNGNIIPVEIRATKVQLLGKDYLMGIFRDITDRKEAEHKIRESEERFRVVFERSTVGMSLTRLDGSFLRVNKAFSDMLGYKIEELQGVNFEAITHPDDVTESREHICPLIVGEKTMCRFEKRYLHKNGSIVWADVGTTLLRDAQGTPLHLITSITDITERKDADAALRKSELLFRRVFKDHTAVKLIIDPDTGDILDANRAAADFYGWPYKQLTRMKIQDINTLPPEDIEKEMKKARENKRIHFEFRHRRADGSIRDVGVFSSKIKGNKKDLLHSIVFDITPRKQAEATLHDTLDRLRNAINTTIQVIVSTVEARDPYTAGHQARTADLARSIATEMGLHKDKIEGIRIAGSIHDIGKLSVPAEILAKPGKLTEMEFGLIKEHPTRGCEILKNIDSPWPLSEIVYQHHEHMDGSGYPRNLKGDEILIEARILAVADVVEAMASHRPYRPALGIDATLQEIENNRGVLYDADVADACLKLFREKGYTLKTI